MCDPVSIGLGIGMVGMAASASDTARKARHATEDAARNVAAERAEAEAKAAQSANYKLAQDSRRRREQKSLLAAGAPQPTFGDEAASTDGGMLTTAASVARRSSLLSRGGFGSSLAGPSSVRPTYRTRTEGIGRPSREAAL